MDGLNLIWSLSHMSQHHFTDQTISVNSAMFCYCYCFAQGFDMSWVAEPAACWLNRSSLLVLILEQQNSTNEIKMEEKKF